MTDVHSGRLVTDAIVAALNTAGLRVGDGIEPVGGGWTGAAGQSTFNAYVVVYPMAGGEMDGTLGAVYADATPLYQFSCYGANRGQAEFVADAVHVALTGAALTIAGRRVAQIRPDILGGATRADGVQPPIWYAVPRYRIAVTSNNT